MSFEALELTTIIQQVKSHCSFTLGMELIEQLAPSFDRLVIERENKRIKEALACVVHYREMPFSGIRDIRESLSATLKGRMITPMECLYVADFIRGVSGIRTYMQEVQCEKEELCELTDTLVVFDALKKELENCFNEYGDVVDSASFNLASIRREIRRTEEQLTSAANKFVTTHANAVADGIITTRNSRVCVLVKDSYKNSFGGIVYGTSASGAASYVEPSVLMPLNNKKQSLLYAAEKNVALEFTACP
ncbi:MAG: endonuclease MutS2, partial [Erysipelotrichaceae bacterium]|nr:endonuclease MutS2 [Erysipelotrichaceae bacterium]